MDLTSKDWLHKIAQIIYDKKGFNILALDLRSQSSLTDFFIVAEGNVERHVQAISQEIQESLAKDRVYPLLVEGRDSGDWIVLDYVDVVIHLFKPGLRERYNLEGLWSKGELVHLDIQIAS